MRQLSSIAKQEIIVSPLSSDGEKLAFISAIFRVSGTLIFSGGQKAYAVKVEGVEKLDEILEKLLLELDDTAFNFDIINGAFVFKGEDFSDLLDQLKIFVLDKKTQEVNYTTNIHSSLKNSPSIALASLKGLFVGAGSVSVASGYHLEFNFNNGFLASDTKELFSEFNIDVKIIKRGERHVVYIKKQETIGDVLTLLGATAASLKLIDQSAQRESSQLINRRYNCDIANLNKQSELAAKQIQALQHLVDNNLLHALDKKLVQTAKLRLENPELTLAEFAALLGISKSGARHRLEKLLNIE